VDVSGLVYGSVEVLLNPVVHLNFSLMAGNFFAF
jgi:hypothetical protein